MPLEQKEAIYVLIGQRIHDCRKGKNMSQETLASKIGQSRVSIVQIERGKQRLTLHTFYEIANALDMTIQDILGNMPNDLPDKAEYILHLENENKLLREQNDYLQLLLDRIRSIAENRR